MCNRQQNFRLSVGGFDCKHVMMLCAQKIVLLGCGVGPHCSRKLRDVVAVGFLEESANLSGNYWVYSTMFCFIASLSLNGL